DVCYSAYQRLLLAFPNLCTVYLTHIGPMNYINGTLPAHWACLFYGLSQGQSKVTKVVAPSLFLPVTGSTGAAIQSPYSPVLRNLLVPTITSFVSNPIKQLIFADAIPLNKRDNRIGGAPDFGYIRSRAAIYDPN